MGMNKVNVTWNYNNGRVNLNSQYQRTFFGRFITTDGKKAEFVKSELMSDKKCELWLGSLADDTESKFTENLMKAKKKIQGSEKVSEIKKKN